MAVLYLDRDTPETPLQTPELLFLASLLSSPLPSGHELPLYSVGGPLPAQGGSWDFAALGLGSGITALWGCCPVSHAVVS